MGLVYRKHSHPVVAIFLDKPAKIFQEDRQWFIQKLQANDAAARLRHPRHPNSPIQAKDLSDFLAVLTVGEVIQLVQQKEDRQRIPENFNIHFVGDGFQQYVQLFFKRELRPDDAVDLAKCSIPGDLLHFEPVVRPAVFGRRVKHRKHEHWGVLLVPDV